MASRTTTESLTTCVGVLASTTRIDAVVEWITINVASLGGSTFIAHKNIADRLLQAQRMALNPRMLSLSVESIDHSDSDVMIAEKVLSGKIKAVLLFKDFYCNETIPDLNLLARVCETANTPLALNPATADLVLKGVSNTRVAYLIFNPVAGQGDSEVQLEKIKAILEPTMNLVVIMTEKDVDVAEQTKEVVKTIQSNVNTGEEDETYGDAIIVASGGDGTVSAIAGATMGTGIPFAAIPRGTANAFSVAMGIPTDIEAAARNILTGQVRIIDGGTCNGTPFINLAGVGFEAGLVENASRELKNIFGNVAYMIGGAQQAIQQEPFKCTITIDDQEPETITTKVITVANVAPPSSVFAQGFGKIIPDDGLFEVTVTSGSAAFDEIDALATLWASSVVKAALPSKNVLRIRAKTIVVDCQPPQKLLMDGEVLEANPVTFQVVPNGLSVITPADGK